MKEKIIFNSEIFDKIMESIIEDKLNDDNNIITSYEIRNMVLHSYRIKNGMKLGEIAEKMTNDINNKNDISKKNKLYINFVLHILIYEFLKKENIQKIKLQLLKNEMKIILEEIIMYDIQ